MEKSKIIVLSEQFNFDALLERLQNIKIIMMGEATHGTHEFYKARIELTKNLIEKHKITAVTLEGDWPSLYRVNKFVQGRASGDTALTALTNLKQFPSWMWRNRDFLEFVEWLYQFNQEQPEKNRVGIFGLDLYSLHASAEAVIKYLEKIDPEEAKEARKRYACFDKFGFDMQQYGFLTTQKLTEDCEKEIIEQLTRLQENALRYLKKDGFIQQEELFCAEQNSIVVRDAEQYYKSLFFSNSNLSWNLRDTHMANILKNLYSYQKAQDKNPKIIVWAHNSHIGDARATQFGEEGQINIGQLAREYFGKQNVFLLGFSTYHGTVSAASNWDGAVERKLVRPALEKSYEDLFHSLENENFLIFANEIIPKQMLQRAIGVIYRPQTERYSHYFFADLKNQFDAMIHFDTTQAVEPLEKTAAWEKGELPETYPFGI